MDIERRLFLKAATKITIGAGITLIGIGDRGAGNLIDGKIWRDTRKEVVAEGNIPPSKLDEVVDERAKQKKAEEGHSVARDWVDLPGAPVIGGILIGNGIRDWQLAKYIGRIPQALHEALASRDNATAQSNNLEVNEQRGETLYLDQNQTKNTPRQDGQK